MACSLPSIRSKFADEKFATFGVDFNNKDLGILRDLAESGKIVPAVTKTYPLTKTAAAYKYLETGDVQGKDRNHNGVKLVRQVFKWTSIVILLVMLAAGLFLFVAYWLSTNDCERNTAALAHPMKAIRKCEYGAVTLRDVETPAPADDQILLRFARHPSTQPTGTCSAASCPCVF